MNLQYLIDRMGEYGFDIELNDRHRGKIVFRSQERVIEGRRNRFGWMVTITFITSQAIDYSIHVGPDRLEWALIEGAKGQECEYGCEDGWIFDAEGNGRKCPHRVEIEAESAIDAAREN